MDTATHLARAADLCEKVRALPTPVPVWEQRRRWDTCAQWLRTNHERLLIDPAVIAGHVNELRAGHHVTCHPVSWVLWLATDPDDLVGDTGGPLITLAAGTPSGMGRVITTDRAVIAARDSLARTDYYQYGPVAPGADGSTVPAVGTYLAHVGMTSTQARIYDELRAGGMRAADAEQAATDTCVTPRREPEAFTR